MMMTGRFLIGRRQRAGTTSTTTRTRNRSSRRLLSSITNPYPTAPLTAPTIPASLPKTSGVPSLVSRRQWNQLYKPPSRGKRGSKTDPLDDKPWPQSVKLLGLGLGCTVVPYCICWYIAANQTIRDDYVGKIVPQFIPFLRRWFGEEEMDSSSYVDRLQQQKQGLEEGEEIPRSLDMEMNSKERKEQENLHNLIEKDPIPTRLRVFTTTGFNMSEIMDLPGTTTANTKTLLRILMKDRDRTIGENDISHVTVEFTDIKQQQEEEDGGDLVTIHNFPEEDQDDTANTATDTAAATLKGQMNTMVKNTGIFSSWHYFPEILIQQQQRNREEAASKLKKSSSSTSSGDDIRKNRLEYEIGRLQNEITSLQNQLKDPATMRSFDDIQDDINRHKSELNQYKSELRRLKWKKRLNFFG